MSEQWAVGYVRLSDTSDTSIGQQVAEIREYADTQGYELTHIYNEGERVSGFDTTREKYQQMIEAGRSGGFAHVIVRSRSRLGRDKRQRLQHLLELDRLGVDIHVVGEGPIDATDTSALVNELFEAHGDDDVKRKEIEASKQETERRLDNGYWQGRVPFGLAFDDAGQYLIPGGEFQRALAILSDREQGRTYREIAQRRDVSKDTVSGVLGHAEEYQRLADDERARIGYDWQVVTTEPV